MNQSNFVKKEDINLLSQMTATPPTIFYVPTDLNRKTIGGLGTAEEMAALLTALFRKLSERYDVQKLLENVSDNLKNNKFPEGELLIIAHLFVKRNGKNFS